MNQMHEIDYKVLGDDMQFVEIELDPREAAIAEIRDERGARTTMSARHRAGRNCHGDDGPRVPPAGTCHMD